ncbi:MAG: MiaB/RimO family radical SAM methylthiotransferase [Candidatus Omnitrophica bacterium]|nr:MiaB/RimO family radical SAM methylthiotransferase [Candidatus Omnitrophota bacterium]MDD5518324.1 MiaB/RimO family radical SAM methylthiotransferase [Candidatus Omnitrophota bacterium]
MPRIKFHTLGCKVNQYDTQSIRERFFEHGFKEARGPAGKADVYLINTCTVTSSADQKSRAAIRSSIKENPEAKIIVTGCLVKNDSRQLAKIKGISFIVNKSFFAAGITDFHSHTRAFLKIQDGCDNFCAYCKVPLVRGRSRSRPLAEIVPEARRLAKNGFKEIVLTGICLGAYGRDLKPRISLVEAVAALEKIGGILRIRLSSIEAGDISDALINKMAESKKLCRHLHIPMQSGDDEILKRMRRRYTRSYYIKLIRKIKKKIPGLGLTTDCLVGFPGETEKHFRNTLQLIKRIIPLKVHIFPYSRREGTLAGSKLSGGIPALIIKERISRLKSWAEDCAKDYKKSFLGARVPVLFEGKSKEVKGYWEGYTDNYIRVMLKSRRSLENKLIFVRLRNISGDCALDKIRGRCYKYGGIK